MVFGKKKEKDKLQEANVLNVSQNSERHIDQEVQQPKLPEEIKDLLKLIKPYLEHYSGMHPAALEEIKTAVLSALLVEIKEMNEDGQQ